MRNLHPTPNEAPIRPDPHTAAAWALLALVAIEVVAVVVVVVTRIG